MELLLFTSTLSNYTQYIDGVELELCYLGKEREIIGPPDRARKLPDKLNDFLIQCPVKMCEVFIDFSHYGLLDQCKGI